MRGLTFVCLATIQSAAGAAVLPQEIFRALDSVDGLETIKAWLEARGDPDAMEPVQGGTMLHWAAARGNVGLTKLLLKHGGAVNVHAERGGGPTPLILAAGKGHVETVKLLLAAQGDPDDKDDRGVSALMYAEAEERRFQEQHKHAADGEHVVAKLLRAAKQRLADAKDEV